MAATTRPLPLRSRTSSYSNSSSSSNNPPRLSPHRLWLILFGLWLVFLSGLLSPFVGSPGVIQAVRLKNVLQAKQEQFDQTESTLLRIQADAELLEKNKLVQHREIRKVLGYAAPDELIFDFSF